MSSLAASTKAAAFFVLGIAFAGAIVATTHYADAQFGLRRPMQTVVGLHWSFQRAELAAQTTQAVPAKCLSTESVISGGYTTLGAEGNPTVQVLSSYPDHFENSYVVNVRNASQNRVTVYSYVGCALR